MTRAEEAALKAYPVDICGYTVECRVGAKPQPQDWNEIRRTHFQEGYEQAEKDTIERVIEWVKSNGHLYVNRVKEGDEYVGEFMEEPFVESLRKAMEEKK